MPSGEIIERIERAYKDATAIAEEQAGGPRQSTPLDDEIIEGAAQVWEGVDPGGDDLQQLAFVMGVHVGFKAGSDAS
jgi:hypothetical protein